MKIELTTISTKTFLLITLLSIPVILFFSIGLAILTSTQWLVYLIVPLLGLTIFFGQRFSKTSTKIDLSEGERFQVNDQEIRYDSVIGYFINETGLTQTALCLRLSTNKTIQITGASIGEQGKAFQKAQDEIIRTLKSRNSQLLELEYQDVYVRQTNILRPFIYVMAGVVIILDLIAVYLLVTGKMKVPWQVFFVNLLLVGLIPYLKKGKITNANKTYKQ
jgi:ABC-type multidrug transport system fused ATPase/permease subunit